MTDCNLSSTPAEHKTVGLDPIGAPHGESWTCSSNIGMLRYPMTNTRCDLSFAVTQAARFYHAPKKSHTAAVKRILRYLKGTADKGTGVVHQCCCVVGLVVVAVIVIALGTTYGRELSPVRCQNYDKKAATSTSLEPSTAAAVPRNQQEATRRDPR